MFKSFTSFLGQRMIISLCVVDAFQAYFIYSKAIFYYHLSLFNHWLTNQLTSYWLLLIPLLHYSDLRQCCHGHSPKCLGESRRDRTRSCLRNDTLSALLYNRKKHCHRLPIRATLLLSYKKSTQSAQQWQLILLQKFR